MITNINSSTNPAEVKLSFDLDYTLIKTKSGRKFPKDKDDWIGWDEVINTIKEPIIIIFTNQAGRISNDDLHYKLKNIGDYIKKTNPIVKRVYYVASRKYDNFRKPNIGMVNYIMNKTNLIISKKMLYVGDAAGRIATKSRKKDFSSSDKAFAQNAKFLFQTPEEFINDK